MIDTLSKNPIARRLLNLTPPDDEADTGNATGAAEAASQGGDEGPEVTETRYQGWSEVQDSSRRQASRKAGRIVLWIVAGLIFLLGIRSLFNTNKNTSAATARPAAVSTFPSGQAQAVATRWASAFLTFNSDDPTAQADRTTLLSQDTASGVDLSQSWNGQGSEKVLTTLPGQVNVSSNTAASVTVYMQVNATAAGAAAPTPSPSPTAPVTPKPSTKPTPKPSAKPTPKPTKKKASSTSGAAIQPVSLSAAAATPGTTWVGMSVPVGWDGRRVIVTGLPAFVALPAPGAQQNAPSAPTEDAALTAQTQGAASSFFAAYAGTDSAALSSMTAPGASITPLGGAVTFDQLEQWSVAANPVAIKSTDSSTAGRTAQAVVVWNVGGARLTQAYNVRLQPVTSAGATVWRVAAVSVNTSPISQ